MLKQIFVKKMNRMTFYNYGDERLDNKEYGERLCICQVEEA
jgi:hypothetical protein